MRKINFSVIILLLVWASCRQKEAVQDTETIIQPPADTTQNRNAGEEKSKELSYKIIPAENGAAGFGYDIYVNGALYVHQPTIPAIQGNRAFSSEEKAQQAAKLVISKIKNNTLPPMVEISELDSLGLLD